MKPFNANIPPKIVSLNPDIYITQPSTGQIVRLLGGTTFFFDYFKILEDPALSQAINECRDYLGQNISVTRDTLWQSRVRAAQLMALVDLPNQFNPKEIQTLIRYFITEVGYLPGSNWYMSAILLYGGALTLANQLDYPLNDLA